MLRLRPLREAALKRSSAVLLSVYPSDPRAAAVAAAAVTSLNGPPPAYASFPGAAAAAALNPLSVPTSAAELAKAVTAGLQLPAAGAGTPTGTDAGVTKAEVGGPGGGEH